MKKFLSAMLALSLLLSTPALASDLRADQDDAATVVIGGWELTNSPDEQIDYMLFRSGFGAGTGAYGLLLDPVLVDMNNNHVGDSGEKLVTILNSKASASAMSAKMDAPSGSTSQYMRGNGSLATFPTIPDAQVQCDWNETDGIGEILHKPSIFSGVYSDLSGLPSLFSGSYSDLSDKPSLFSGAYSDLSGKPTLGSAAALNVSAGANASIGQIVKGNDTRLDDARTPLSHVHDLADVTGLVSALAGKQATISPGASIADAATNAAVDAATDAPTNAATNAVTNLATNYNLVSGVLGIADGLNSANAAQNDLAAKYNTAAGNLNSAATKYNAAAGKYNAAAAKLNDASTKLNTLLSHLEAQGIQTP